MMFQPFVSPQNQRKVRDNNDGVENINDEDGHGDIVRSASFIKVKPSLMQSENDTDENAGIQSINRGLEGTTKSKKSMIKLEDKEKMRLLYGGRKARDYGLTNNSLLYGHNETEAVNLS